MQYLLKVMVCCICHYRLIVVFHSGLHIFLCLENPIIINAQPLNEFQRKASIKAFIASS
jgi:hypothetical protein